MESSSSFQVNGVGAEVRRIHIIYFLSRKGRIEHPHLIRLHHLSRNGVRLRDVKRWLSELRGNEMPHSFSWSYKRRYKSGYVWQDLLDEDLITPISDNEYVLKGSEISSNSSSSSCSKENSLSHEEKQSPRKEEEIIMSPENQELETKTTPSPPQSPPPTQEEIQFSSNSQSFGSEKSTITEDHSGEEIHQDEEANIQADNPLLCSNPSKKKTKNGKIKEKKSTISSSSTTTSGGGGGDLNQSSTFSRSKSYSNGASLLFRNLINCRTSVETNDSAMVTINKATKPSLITKQNLSSDVIKGDKLGGSQRVFGTTLNSQSFYPARRSLDGVKSSTKNKGEFGNQKAVPPYKPINGPHCSQCGKQFKPEKLHAHMKSCKGMKALAKGNNPAVSAEKSSDRSSEFPLDNNNSVSSGFYLTHHQQ